MADQSIEKAQALKKRLISRLQELEAERTSIHQQLATVEGFLRTAEAFAALGDDEPAPSVASHSVTTGGGKRPRNPRREETIAAVIDIVTAAGEPMQLRQLYDALLARGFSFHGADPVAVLGTQLWRGGQDGELVNARGLGYWPADRPLPKSKR